MSHDDKEQLVKALLDTNPFTSPEAAARTMERAANALLDMPSARAINLRDEDVEWVVNDIAELGVKIGNQFFWLYKGHSLVYGTEDDPERKDGICLHDNGKPMHWRPVGKREFGECCHPVNYKDPSQWGTVSLDDSDEWKPLPAAFDAPSTEAPINAEAVVSAETPELQKDCARRPADLAPAGATASAPLNAVERTDIAAMARYYAAEKPTTGPNPVHAEQLRNDCIALACALLSHGGHKT